MEKLKRVLEALGLPEQERAIRLLSQYRALVLERNEQVNLTAIKDPEDFEIKHFADSLACVPRPEFQRAETVLDLGTGAGFPGIPLAVLFPEKRFVLLDSLNKRVRILSEFSETLGLRNVSAVHGRAEELGRNKEYRERFDLVLSRAVADLPVLCEYCMPFVKIGGAFGAYKSVDAELEAERAKSAAFLLGGEISGCSDFPFPWLGLDHKIVWIAKRRGTPAKYPRKAGTPAKDPL